MEEFGKIEIKVIGRIGNEPLSPDNFDIREIRGLFDVVETMLYPNQKYSRSPITYSLESGSVRNIFRTSLQSARAFLAVVGMIQETGSLMGLDLPIARAMQEVQKSAVRNNFRYEFGSANQSTPALVISRETNFHINENLWADAEFYFYGRVINAGGKEKTNIHLQTQDHGVLIIDTDKELLRDQEGNILYRLFSVHAQGRQNILTGDIDTSSLRLLEMSPCNSGYDAEYLDTLIKRASGKWEEVGDIDLWLSELRGTNG